MFPVIIWLTFLLVKISFLVLKYNLRLKLCGITEIHSMNLSQRETLIMNLIWRHVEQMIGIILTWAIFQFSNHILNQAFLSVTFMYTDDCEIFSSEKRFYMKLNAVKIVAANNKNVHHLHVLLFSSEENEVKSCSNMLNWIFSHNLYEVLIPGTVLL